MKLRVHQIIKKTKSEGPNIRYCIWTQGCSLKCKNCFMKKAWSKKGGKLVDIDEIYSEIKNLKNEIEGVTFLGGEPFEQAEALSILSEKIKNLNLGIITFSGYTFEELKAKNDDFINKLLHNTDLLIDGRYIEEEKDYSRALIGSKNQRYIYLTERYNEDMIKSLKNKFEIRIEKNGCIKISGMGDLEKLNAFLAKIKTHIDR